MSNQKGQQLLGFWLRYDTRRGLPPAEPLTPLLVTLITPTTPMSSPGPTLLPPRYDKIMLWRGTASGFISVLPKIKRKGRVHRSSESIFVVLKSFQRGSNLIIYDGISETIKFNQTCWEVNFASKCRSHKA